MRLPLYLIPRVRVARLRRGNFSLFTLNVWTLHTSPRCQCALEECRVPSTRGLLEFDVSYHVATIAVPFAILLGSFLFDPNLTLFYQFSELATPSYEFCGHRLAEYYPAFVKHYWDNFKSVFGGFQSFYVFGE